MDVEFLPEQPDPSDATADVIVGGGRRRHPRVRNGVLAAVLVAGGIGGFIAAPGAHHNQPAPATKTHHALSVGPYEDALAGCPNTLACDANHQMPQHLINLIKQAMRHKVAGAHVGIAPLTDGGRHGGIGRIFIVP